MKVEVSGRLTTRILSLMMRRWMRKEKAKLGECYTIAGLKITPVAWNGAALFQKTDHLTISNLNLKDPDISCQGQNTAAGGAGRHFGGQLSND